MLQRNDPFDGEMSLEDVQGLGKQTAPKPAAEPAPEAPAPTPKPLAVILPKNGKTLLGDPADQVVINPPDKARINEAKEQHGVFTFGRFNPPTVGHEKLIHATEKVAAEHKVPAHIIASHSDNTSSSKATRVKNPVPLAAKVGYLKKVAAPTSKVSHSDSEHPSLLDQAEKLHKQGVTHLHMVAGEDRVGEYHKLLHKYNGTHEGARFNFKHIEVHSAGHRDPDAEGTEGMSGTKMRAAAKAGDKKTFKSGLPKALHPHAEEIANHIRAVKEEVEEGEDVLLEATVSMTTRMHRAVNMRKNKARMEKARAIARRRLAKQAVLNRRAMKKAKNILRVKLAGQQGANYANLSAAQKIGIDRMVDRKKGAVKKIAQKIAPRIKSDEMRRLQTATAGKSFRSSKMVVSASYELIGNMISEKEKKSIMEKAEASGYDYQTLLQVFNRGKAAFKQSTPSGKTPSQYGYDRLNSFINGGKAMKEDIDLHEQDKSIRKFLQHTPRNVGTLPTDAIPKVQPAAQHAAAIKDTNDDDEITKKRKRADIIRRKTSEYVRKVVESRGVRNETSPSLLEEITAMLAPRVCVPEEDYIYEEWTEEQWNTLLENDNEGRALNKPFRTPGGPKKFAVYVKNDKGNIIKLGFGDPNLEIKRDDPDRRKAYRARHGCDNPGPKWKANWWSCNWSWSANKKVGA